MEIDSKNRFSLHRNFSQTMNSTDNRVPLTTGLPSNISGFECICFLQSISDVISPFYFIINYDLLIFAVFYGDGTI